METRMAKGGFGSDKIFPDNEEIIICHWLFVKESESEN
jgi:hypothetical protein